MSEGMSRLAKQSEKKTRQAQKILEKLKKKREKQRNAQLKVQPPLRSPSSHDREESFRTCLAYQEENLGELYFNIFNEHMTDAGQASAELEKCYKDMGKELTKKQEEVADSQHRIESLSKINKQILNENQSLSVTFKKKMEQMNKDLQQERQKYLELLTSTDPQNVSVLNATVLCEGYEDKIRELVQNLEQKDKQIQTYRNQKRFIQSQLQSSLRQNKVIQRENDRAIQQNQKLTELVGKLTKQIQQKYEDDPQISSKSSSQKIESSEKEQKMKKEYEEAIQSIKSGHQKALKICQMEKNRLTLELLEERQSLDRVKQEKNKSQDELLEKIEQSNQNFKMLQQKLNAEIKKLELQNKGLLNKIQKANQEVTIVQNSINMEQAEQNTRLQAQVLKLKQDLSASDKNIQKLNSNLFNSMAASQSFSKDLDNLKNVHKQTERLIKLNEQQFRKDLKSKEEEMAQLYKKLTQQNKILQDEIGELREQVDEFELRVTSMKEENKSLISEREDARSKLNQLAIQREVELKKMRQTEQKLKQITQQMKYHQRDEIIDTEKDQRQKQREEQQRRKTDELQKLRSMINVSKVKINTIEAQNGKLRTKIKQYQLQISQLQGSNNEEKKFMAQKEEGGKKDQTDKQGGLQILKRKIQMLEEEKQELQSDYNEIKQKLQIFEQAKSKQNTKYISTIEQLTKQLNDAYAKLNDKTEQLLTTEQEKPENAINRNRQNQKGELCSSPEKGTGKSRKRSVNKLKSYFGFGSTE